MVMFLDTIRAFLYEILSMEFFAGISWNTIIWVFFIALAVVMFIKFFTS